MVGHGIVALLFLAKEQFDTAELSDRLSASGR